MIAIGFSYAGGQKTPFEQNQTGGVATLFAEASALSEPRDRLRACLACAQALDSFLPLAARHAVELEKADAWAAEHHDHVLSELDRLSGWAELSIELTNKARPERSLRARATARTKAEFAASLIERRLAPSATRRHYRNGCVRMQALLPRARAGTWRSELAALPSDAFDGFRLTSIGPWPPFSFFAGPT